MVSGIGSPEPARNFPGLSKEFMLLGDQPLYCIHFGLEDPNGKSLVMEGLTLSREESLSQFSPALLDESQYDLLYAAEALTKETLKQKLTRLGISTVYIDHFAPVAYVRAVHLTDHVYGRGVHRMNGMCFIEVGEKTDDLLQIAIEAAHELSHKTGIHRLYLWWKSANSVPVLERGVGLIGAECLVGGVCAGQGLEHGLALLDEIDCYLAFSKLFPLEVAKRIEALHKIDLTRFMLSGVDVDYRGSPVIFIHNFQGGLGIDTSMCELQAIRKICLLIGRCITERGNHEERIQIGRDLLDKDRYDGTHIGIDILQEEYADIAAQLICAGDNNSELYSVLHAAP